MNRRLGKSNANHTSAVARSKRATFFRQWMKNPRSMASVSPSGRQLAGLMAAALPDNSRHVVELGAGTGSITTALLEHGIESDELLTIEMNPVLHGVLQRQFPNVHVVCGDARQLRTLLNGRGPLKAGNIDAVCSSLGLLTMPKSLQHAVLEAAFDVLRPGGVFIQYTYGPFGHPVHDEVSTHMQLDYHVTGIAWRNLPPARVFVYHRT